jgi:hypothetical protein
MNTTMKTLSALALATATLSAATLATSSIASANGTGVIVPTKGNVHGPVTGGNVHGAGTTVLASGTGVIVPTQGNVHGVIGGNVHGSGTNVPASGTGVIVPTQGNVHGLGGTSVIEPSRPSQPGQVISCHPGTGCTITPTQPPAGSPPASNPPGQVISCHPGTGCTLTPPADQDHDHDHDYDRDHDHWHWSHWDRRGWDFPVIAVSGYAPDSCVYVYKFRTVYVPGFGLERVVVKVCEAE